MSSAVAHLLDTYCERAGAVGLLAEPLNALSNLAFLVAAAFAWRRLAALHPGPARDLRALLVGLVAIGLGSATWHLWPTPRTMLLDIVPIALFINLYLLVALRRLLALPWPATAGWWAAYVAAGLAVHAFLPGDLFNGSILYAPTWLALALLTVAVARHEPPRGRALGGALLAWSLALLLRSIDRAICDGFPFGSHFAWHLLNAWVLWRLLLLLGQVERR